MGVKAMSEIPPMPIYIALFEGMAICRWV